MRIRNTLFAGLLALSGQPGLAQQECRPGHVDLRGDWGSHGFSVELADTPEAHARGLMFRTELGADAGMLFIYDRPRPVSFWMKNTLIPLDMIFVNPAGVVTKVHAQAIPGDLRPIAGPDDTLYVLEIPGGRAAELGIVPGSELRHPALGEAARWPCAAQ